MESEKIKTLAILLSKVHSHSLSPFYGFSQENFWESLPEKAQDKSDVDKKYFIEMAKCVLNEMETLK